MQKYGRGQKIRKIVWFKKKLGVEKYEFGSGKLGTKEGRTGPYPSA